MDVVEGGQLTFAQALEHWYYSSKFRLLERSLRRLPLRGDEKLADFGCGLGVFLRLLELHGVMPPRNMCGVDSAYHARAHVPDSSIPIYPAFPRDGGLFDVILLMDVLEHIADDVGALSQVVAHCRPGAHLFITVPAFQALWSRHDEYLGHHRRYTTRSLRRLISTCHSLAVVRTHYFYAYIFPAAAAVRLVRSRQKDGASSDLKPVPAPLNKLLALAGRVESTVAGLNHIAGLSVVAVCRVLAKPPISRIGRA